MIVDEILGGQHDESLRAISDAIQERQKILARRLAAELQAGDKVRFNAHASPKYLQGIIATVTGSRQGANVEIKLDEPVGKFQANYAMRCPTAILDKVEVHPDPKDHQRDCDCLYCEDRNVLEWADGMDMN